MKTYKVLWRTMFIVIILICTACSPPSKNKNTAQDTNTQASGKINADVNKQEITVDPQPAVSIEESLKADSDVLQNQAKADVEKPITLPVPANFVLIPGGVFRMGSNEGDHDEVPVREIKVNAFHMGKYEVSQKDYRMLMGNNPSSFKGDNLPVENVSWHDAVEYCNRLSVKEGLKPAYQGEGDGITCNFTASGYRLPTEAEWEYAAGDGSKSLYAGSNNVATVGWYNVNSNGTPNEIGGKAANSRVLYDMSGNVAEWCWDWYGDYSNENENILTGIFIGKARVARGGAWGDNERDLRISARKYYAPTVRNGSIGFRIVRSAL
jgi:formylglycine-generating enzyme required for sulfatase activity